MPKYYPNSFRQRGLTMIEVLIVVIVMAVGLLGVAALQVTGVRQAGNAGRQTQAMMLAQDLIDRIRANRTAAIDNSGNVIATNYGKASGTAFPTSAVAGCTTSAGCTPSEMATSDLYAWSQLIQNSLPVDANNLQNDIYVCLDSDSTDSTTCDGQGSTFVIHLAWQETSNVTGNLQTYEVSFEP